MKALVFCTMIMFLFSFQPADKKCTISGNIIEVVPDTTLPSIIKMNKSDTILLFKVSKWPIMYEAKIPIVNNTFNYSFNFVHPEVYQLVYQEEFKHSSIKIRPFFSEEGNIEITLLGNSDRKGKVKGFPIRVKGFKNNDDFNEYYNRQIEKFWVDARKYTDSLLILNKVSKCFSEDFWKLQEKMKSTKDNEKLKQLYNERNYLESTGLMYTPEARKYRKIQDSILNEQKIWEFDYIDKNTSLLSYYLFMEDIRETAKSCCWTVVDAELINKAKTNLNRYASAFPGHPYFQVIKNTIDGLSNIHEGGRFIDFSGNDINGKNYSLAKIIKSNKIILLDFWSTWCVPCIKTSREMIPVYKDFRNRGFEIVGITQSDERMDFLKNFIKKEQYPWTNLIDENGKSGIWDKYNLTQQGGGTFLVNASGRIIAVNLTAGKVREKLNEMLK